MSCSCSNDFDFDKDIDIHVDTDLYFGTENDYDSDLDINADVCAEVNINSNIATLGLDAEAVGRDTLVEVYATVLTVENEYSGVSLSVTSAVA